MAKKKSVRRQIIKRQNYNFIYKNFLIAVDFLKTLKNYIWFSCGLFLLTIIIGYLFPIFFVTQVQNLIQELIKETQGLNFFELIKFIITNNMQSAFSGMILGVFFAVVPIAILVVNGYVLGFVANKSVSYEGFLILWRLLPHGIFEIPAIIISISLGMKLGLFLLVYKGENKKKEFLEWIKNSLRVFILVVIPLLVIAGIIEASLIRLIG